MLSNSLLNSSVALWTCTKSDKTGKITKLRALVGRFSTNARPDRRPWFALTNQGIFTQSQPSLINANQDWMKMSKSCRGERKIHSHRTILKWTAASRLLYLEKAGRSSFGAKYTAGLTRGAALSFHISQASGCFMLFLPKSPPFILLTALPPPPAWLLLLVKMLTHFCPI